MNVKVGVLLFCFVFVAACTGGAKVKPDSEIVPMPEPLLGINVFVANDLVAIPAEGVLAQKHPNPYKPLAFDDKATVDAQQLALGFSTDLRERILPVFRAKIAQTYCFVAGASYPWNELRRDQRNYFLIIWPTRAGVQSQQVDLRAALVHESTGRLVWQYSFKDPYRSVSALSGKLSQPEREAIVRDLSEKMLSELSRQGFLAGVSAPGRS